MIVFGYREHILYAEFLGFMISGLLDFTLTEKIIYFACIPIGAMLPDIDKENTKLGSKIKFISRFINNKVGHRTLTHSLFFTTVLFYSSIIAFGMNIVSVGLMVGCVMHIFFDMMTPMGVPLAYPFSTKHFKL